MINKFWSPVNNNICLEYFHIFKFYFDIDTNMHGIPIKALWIPRKNGAGIPDPYKIYFSKAEVYVLISVVG